MTIAFIIRGASILGDDGIVIPGTVHEVHDPDPGVSVPARGPTRCCQIGGQTMTTNWLPPQLKDPRIHFIRLRPLEKNDDTSSPFPYKKGSGKLPADKEWPTKRYYYWDEKKIREWKEKGNNIGVIMRSGLIGFDADELDRLQKLGKISILPPTFSDRTGGGGMHYWYWCKPLQRKIVFHDPELTEPDKKDPTKHHPKHLGEIQQGNHFVAAPGSLHHTGNYYEIVDDLPIATLDIEVVDAFLEGLIVNQKVWDPSDPMRFERGAARKTVERVKSEVKKTTARGGKNLASLVNVPVEDVVFPADLLKDDGTVAVGSNPWHGSTSGQNFSINRANGLWHCWHHHPGTGGTWVEALAVNLGFLSCDECLPGCLRGSKFVQFFAEAAIWAEERGYKFPTMEEFFPKREPHPTVPTTSASEFAETLKTKFEDPETSQIFVWGVPRIGKTHEAMKYLAEAEGGVSIAPTHNILAHQVRIFGELGGRGAVHLKGKNRSCNRQVKKRRSNCDRCPRYPKTPEKMMDIQRYAQGLVGSDRVCLSEAVIDSEHCPYYTLLEAARTSRYVFTVPQLAAKICAESEVGDGDLLVIDEEGVARQFFAQSVAVSSPKGGIIDTHLDRLIEEHLLKIRETAEIGERSSGVEKAAIGLIDYLRRSVRIIDELYTIPPKKKRKEKASEEPTEAGKPPTSEESLMAELRTTLVEMQDSIEPEMRGEVLGYIEARSRGYIPKDGEPTPGELIKAILYNYAPIPCGWVETEKGSVLYITGNEEAPSEDLEWLRAFPKRILLGGPVMDKLAEAIDPAGAKIRVSDQKYPENYVAIVITGPASESEGDQGRLGWDREKTAFESKTMMQALDLTTKAEPGASNGERIIHGVGVLSGSRKGQEKAKEHVEGDRGKAIRWSSRRDLAEHYRSGAAVGLFANSIQARGVDAEVVNTCFVESLSFLTPHWSLRTQIPRPEKGAGNAAWAEWRDNRDVVFDEIHAIVSDEAANLVLRTSPIHGRFEDQPKLVVINGEDLRYVEDKFLEKNIIKSSDGHCFTPDSIASAIRDLGLTSRVTKSAEGQTTRSEIHASPEAVDAVRDGTIAELVRSYLDEEPHPKTEEGGRGSAEAEVLRYLKHRASWIGEIAENLGMEQWAVKRVLAENKTVLASKRKREKTTVWTHTDNPNAEADLEAALAWRHNERGINRAKAKNNRLFELVVTLAGLTDGTFEEELVVALKLSPRLVKKMLRDQMIIEDNGKLRFAGPEETIGGDSAGASGKNSTTSKEKVDPGASKRPKWWTGGSPPYAITDDGVAQDVPFSAESFIFDAITDDGDAADVSFSEEDVFEACHYMLQGDKQLRAVGKEVPERGRIVRNAIGDAKKDALGLVAGGLVARQNACYTLTGWDPEGGVSTVEPNEKPATTSDYFYGADLSPYGPLSHKNNQNKSTPPTITNTTTESPVAIVSESKQTSPPPNKSGNQGSNPDSKGISEEGRVEMQYNFSEKSNPTEYIGVVEPPIEADQKAGKMTEDQQHVELSHPPERAGTYPPEYDYSRLPSYCEVDTTDPATWNPAVLDEARAIASAISESGDEISRETIVAALERIVGRAPPLNTARNAMLAIKTALALDGGR